MLFGEMWEITTGQEYSSKYLPIAVLCLKLRKLGSKKGAMIFIHIFYLFFIKMYPSLADFWRLFLIPETVLKCKN